MSSSCYPQSRSYYTCSKPYQVVCYDRNPCQDFSYFVAPQPPSPHPAAFSHRSAIVSSKIEWKDTAEGYVVKVEVPGLRKEEMKLELEDNGTVLCITGEKKVEIEDKADCWYRVERTSGRFVQRLRLPETAKADQMKAKWEDGWICISIPKRVVNNPCSQAIPIY